VPRFFVPVELTAFEQIDINASDMTRLVAINELQHGYAVTLTVFDFTFGFDRRANNRINTLHDVKTSVDGLLSNVLKVGSKTREVDESEYLRFYRALEAKAAHMRDRKKRKLIVTEAHAKDDRSDLP
jgi:hypothetical protein